MYKRAAVVALLVVIATICAVYIRCTRLVFSRPPHLDFSQAGDIGEPQWIGFGNFAVLHVDPNGGPVHYEWRAFNSRNGNAFNVPFEEITLSHGEESYVVTDRGAGNGALRVNDRVYRLPEGESTLVVRFGVGVSFAPAYPYQQARHYYDSFSQGTVFPEG